jgi:hypothetical protein
VLVLDFFSLQIFGRREKGTEGQVLLGQEDRVLKPPVKKYSGSFYLTFNSRLLSGISLIAPTSVPPFAILYLTALLLPSEGFFNLLVYKRHQILKFIRGCKCKHEGETQQNTTEKSEVVENNNREY